MRIPIALLTLCFLVGCGPSEGELKARLTETVVPTLSLSSNSLSEVALALSDASEAYSPDGKRIPIVFEGPDYGGQLISASLTNAPLLEAIQIFTDALPSLEWRITNGTVVLFYDDRPD